MVYLIDMTKEERYEFRRACLIKLLNEQCGGIKSSLANKLGKSPDYVARMLYPPGKKGKKNIGEDLAEEIEKVFPGWQNLSVAREQQAGKANIIPIPNNNKVPLIKWHEIQEYMGMMVAGNLADYPGTQLCPADHGEGTFAVRVQGDSMYNPTGLDSFRDGDIIYVDPTKTPKSGSFVVVAIENNGCMLRRLIIDAGKLYVHAINPDWPQKITEISEGMKICGVVIFSGREPQVI
ncbi:LexA family transcriptional regulator [Nitrosomonas sp. Nm34]|uniref:LexA family protein n=1 Tax=Nitrosomonas sp. Nm34 TaxID=1881055 RepID=UPI0008DF6163|nr:S24 family peptidase [Nitrosomonas sp. Nm34]SFI75132.1 Peptidase S24-like [Nitrosomonas sp. Nm34]